MTLKRDGKSGAWKDRIRLPEDVRLEYQALYGPAWEEKFHRPADTPPDKAVAQHAGWAAKVKDRIAALRASKGGKGVDLTQRQADALAGDWYRDFTSQHLDNPGSPNDWSTLREILWDVAADAGDQETRQADFDDPEVLTAVDTEARASQFLADRGVALTPAGRARFLSAVVGQFLTATETVERWAGGDWSQDKHLDQLAPSPLSSLAPVTTSPSPNGQRSEGLMVSRTSATQLQSAVALFEAYCQDKSPAASTINRWRCVFTALDALPEQEAVRNQRGAQRWLDGLKTEDRSALTVRDIWLSASNTVFGWGVRHGHIEANPFEDCVVEVPRATQTRETGKAFTDAEVLTILSAALRVKVPPLGRRGWRWGAAKRWVPWLMAYTGARVGELTQCRAGDIEQRPCGPVLLITPDAGTVKTRKPRPVPIHPHLVEMGLMDYVATVEGRVGKQGPLFYQPPARPTRKHPAVRARERLAEWIRGLGVTDRGIRPNHGWRHTFKTRAARTGIEPWMRDKICGQAPRTPGEGYEHFTVEDMAEALKRFPRYEVE